MRNKKAQHLTLTTIFVIFIFFLIITLFFDELLVNPKMDGQRYEYLQREANRAVNTLAGTGYPEVWDDSTVQRIGLLTNGIYNETKTSYFQLIPYDLSKEYLGITNNYFLNITNNDTSIIFGLFPDEASLLATNPSYLATQTRTVTSNAGLASITLYVYREIS